MSKRGFSKPHIRGRSRETVCFIPGNSLPPRHRQSGSGGGASRDRTDDLKLAKLALSQLSYGPIGASAMVGREGVEPSTSRLSGVRSNHLSYRPPCLAGHEAAGGVSQLRLHSPRPISRLRSVSRMKGHEDGGIVLWTGGRVREQLYPP